ncbi:MAG: hypothetical protein K6G54_03975, partial [Oscillospiraceae bacterium]|nr:hypothetical protein [Oscillospiraceae bacterium]
MIDLKSRVLRTLMPRRARHVVSCDTYAPAALSKCFSSILIRYQYHAMSDAPDDAVKQALSAPNASSHDKKERTSHGAEQTRRFV